MLDKPHLRPKDAPDLAQFTWDGTDEVVGS